MKKSIFFDRDGTLIKDKIYLNDPDDIVYLPSVFEALKQLQDNGFELIVVTNQSGVPRGLVNPSNLHKIHNNIETKMLKNGILLNKFYYAPYLPSSNHYFRKPNPGMLIKAIKDHNIDPSQSWMIGDRETDILSGLRANLKTIFISGTENPKKFKTTPTFIAQNLLLASQFILTHQ